ncbi:MAG: MFS transporter, partial [Pseudomonadota bacterium]
MIPLSLGWVMLVMLVPTYYGDTLGIGLGVAGTVIAVGRVFDIGTDFVTGWLSDRFRYSRLGRKFWITIGLPLFCTAFALLLLPPPNSGPFYLAIVSLFYFFSYTLVEIPHSAIGLELSDNNATRNSLAASKSLFLVGGGLLGAALPSVLGGPSVTAFGYLVAICVCLSLVILPLFLLLVPADKKGATPALPKIRDTIRFVRQNKPLLVLLAVFLLVQTGSAFIGSFSFPYAAHVLGLPEKTGIFWLAAGVGFLFGVPVWLLVMNRLGRVLAWSLSLGLMLPVFIGLMMLGTGTPNKKPTPAA